MDDFGAKLESILNNPQAMGQIMSLAQSLGGNSTAPNKPEPQVGEFSSETTSSPSPSGLDLGVDPKILGSIASLLQNYNSSDDQRIALLNALKPFVKERRYAKIDKAIQIAKLSRMARIAVEMFQKKEGGHV